MNESTSHYKIDYLLVCIYILLVCIGWMCIYATNYNVETTEIIDFSSFYTKQLLFVIISGVVAIMILSMDSKIFSTASGLFYFISILLLLGLFVAGKRVNGALAWYSFGPITIQPAEFAKTATALLFANELSKVQINLKDRFSDFIRMGAVIMLPCMLIILQPDPGSVLVYSSFFIPMFREGLSLGYFFFGLYFLLLFILTLKFSWGVTMIGVGVILCVYAYVVKRKKRKFPFEEVSIITVLSLMITLSTAFIYNNVFKQHHRDRFNLWLRLENNIENKAEISRTVGYNTLQSQGAISSGGVIGKGFLEGTRTKGGFVPEQHTDYIFTVLGEEWGFVGTTVVVLLFAGLIFRIWYLAEKQRNIFTRIYGYCIASVLFVHFFVNIGMVIGILPTIGIPLPFFSYGGSSLLGFTIMLFIFIKLDSVYR